MQAIAGPEMGMVTLTGNGANPMRGGSNLPAGLYRKVCYPHPVRSATRAWRNALVGGEVLVTGARTASELDDQTLTHEVGAIYTIVRRGALQ